MELITNNMEKFGSILKNYQQEEQVPIFEKYVNLTSQLINRPYIQTFKIVKNWQTHTIIRRYNQCIEYKGEIPKDILWWSIRKKDQLTKSPQVVSPEKRN
jgi:hypothetical protein